ncbi:lymphotoxin-beta isoform X2 [Tenrec ecaudatus]|uniref:lymphotoxin-beta isoform X2 n=1 Tax=Tenrec ecaudatus TaxID=94439 RepID=UPI003F5ABB22
MEALGLEGQGGRPQGRGCLLLAVAGAIVLGSVVLSVPITVLTVLALVPQERGGLSSRSCRGRSRKQMWSAPGCLLPIS